MAVFMSFNLNIKKTNLIREVRRNLSKYPCTVLFKSSLNSCRFDCSAQVFLIGLSESTTLLRCVLGTYLGI